MFQELNSENINLTKSSIQVGLGDRSKGQSSCTKAQNSTHCTTQFSKDLSAAYLSPLNNTGVTWWSPAGLALLRLAPGSVYSESKCFQYWSKRYSYSDTEFVLVRQHILKWVTELLKLLKHDLAAFRADAALLKFSWGRQMCKKLSRSHYLGQLPPWRNRNYYPAVTIPSPTKYQKHH